MGGEQFPFVQVRSLQCGSKCRLKNVRTMLILHLRFLGNELRLWDPVAYYQMNNTQWLNKLINKGGRNIGQKGKAKGKEKAPLKKVGGLWHGVAICQGQTEDGNPHRDENDFKKGFNCVVPYGDWDGGDVVLWELGKRVELREGEALFFRGKCINHNAVGISGGVRNCVDLFIHENLMRLDEKRKKNGYKRLRKGKGKGKGKGMGKGTGKGKEQGQGNGEPKRKKQKK